jgi:ubiquinone/menaquinone biosynthesis C-methylase UbiE
MQKTPAEPTGAKDWWRDFFQPITGEVMFESKAGTTEAEVARVLRRTKVRPPADLLDLACGTGRHSLALAERGFAVTGLDYSKPYLEQARKTAKKGPLPVGFVRGDMRDLKAHFPANSFDAVVSLFNSFGYFDKRADDFKVLREVYRVLRPGGWFVLNTLNEGGVLKRLKRPIAMGREPLPGVFAIDEARYDRKALRTICRWTIVDARRPKAAVHRLDFAQNVYSHAELKRLLRRAGFTVVTTWGVLAGGRFDPKTSWHQTIAARKRG